jgi:uncharacterized protein YbjT (DUF2867 family)
MKAILIGATGLVGNLILNEILHDNEYSEVRIFVRKPTGIINPKLKEFVTSMKDIETLGSEIKGDVLINALGTTIKQAGSQKEQQRIDRDLPVMFSKIASGNGVKIMVNVSSVGANLKGNFYLRTKAEMEIGTEKFFPGMVFQFRPGLLVGKRKEFRMAEKIAFGFMKVLNPILIGSSSKYRSMPADKLAKAMVALSKSPAGKPNVLYYPEIINCI